MAITLHPTLIQGSPEWIQARLGLLTASEMKLIITPTLKIADNEKTKTHLYELLAQRITGYVEPHYISDDMLRGKEDEIDAREIYAEEYGDVVEAGFITNDQWGFIIGFSPDGLVGDDGLIEVKSRRQKFQIETILANEVPQDYVIQIQTELLVSGRKWCDFISYSAGLPMFTHRVLPDSAVQMAIIEAAKAFHGKLDKLFAVYAEKLRDDNLRLIPTERKIEEQITI